MRQEAEAVERVDAQHGQPEVECHTREHSERDPLIETIQWRKLIIFYVLIYSLGTSYYLAKNYLEQKFV